MGLKKHLNTMNTIKRKAYKSVSGNRGTNDIKIKLVELMVWWDMKTE